MSNSTRGVIHEASYPSNVNVLSFITIASTGDAQDFGDTYASGNMFGATGSSPTRGIFAGMDPGNTAIDYITIMATGNAIDFGDLSNRGGGRGGCSNGHGGL